MQQLHLVGFTTDLEGLIFSARRGAKSGSFVVPLDEKLVATIAEAHRRRNGDGADAGPLAEIADKQGGRDRPSRAPRPESRLSPREIQGRLRTGRTIAEVAREADVDPEWVERWAAPVMAEQQKVVARARSLVFAKPRGGSSVEPLGRSVAWSVADKGVWLAPEQFDRAWSAYQSLDSWIVRFRYRSRGRDHVAEWEVTDDGELVALDRTASQLAYLDRARRRKAPPRAQMVEATEPEPESTVTEAETPAPAPRARRSAPRKGRARASTKKRASSRGRAPTKKRTVGRPAAAKGRTTKKKTAAKKATAARKTTARKTAARKTAPKKSAARKAAPKRAAKKAPAKKAPAARKATRSRKAGTTRKAARKSAAGRGPGGRRPPAEPVVPRAARARQAATVMLSTEPEVVAAPRFGTPGNPPARRSGAGGRRTVVKARGKKAAATAKARPRANARAAVDTPGALQPETEEFTPVAPAPEPAPAARPGAPAPEARRRRQPRLRASVRRRELDDEAFARGSESDDEEPAVVMVARPDEDPSRAQISAERAGDLVGDQPDADADGIDDSQRATLTAEAPGEAEDSEATGGLLGRRRRRLLRR